jgi:hypothetical protein
LAVSARINTIIPTTSNTIPTIFQMLICTFSFINSPYAVRRMI